MKKRRDGGKRRDWAGHIILLVGCIIICQLAGIIGSIFNTYSIPTWYAGLVKPVFNPPNWVFAPVWTTLFLMMGISLYLVLRTGWEKKEVRFAAGVFAVQLVLNIAWSALFFGLQMPWIAFVEIVILWAAILVTIWRFFRVSKPAAYLLVPYILWVSFAAVLNLSLAILN
jgi:benzodiazapine receptor